ncbi:hypothetical protein MRB53_041929 [Persea americana]|nr:hypothetical protein MRB53_041929 [Persea americana]
MRQEALERLTCRGRRGSLARPRLAQPPGGTRGRSGRATAASPPGPKWMPMQMRLPPPQASRAWFMAGVAWAQRVGAKGVRVGEDGGVALHGVDRDRDVCASGDVVVVQGGAAARDEAGAGPGRRAGRMRRPSLMMWLTRGRLRVCSSVKSGGSVATSLMRAASIAGAARAGRRWRSWRQRSSRTRQRCSRAH